MHPYLGSVCRQLIAISQWLHHPDHHHQLVRMHHCNDALSSCHGIISHYYHLVSTLDFQSTENVAIIINGNYAVYSTGNATWNDFSCNSQGVWTSSLYGTVTSVVCQRSGDAVATTTRPVATTTTVASLCNSCPDVRPKSAGAGAYYDGMIVINHYKDRATQCRKASIDCMTTMDYEVAELLLNSEVINTGSGVGVNLQCSSAGTWTYDLATYQTTSCLVASELINC